MKGIANGSHRPSIAFINRAFELGLIPEKLRDGYALYSKPVEEEWRQHENHIVDLYVNGMAQDKIVKQFRSQGISLPPLKLNALLHDRGVIRTGIETRRMKNAAEKA